MDIVLGVSMTPTTVRMVLVEGDKADGSIVDHDAFDITANDGSATSSSAAEQVVEAVLGTKESAAAGGHHLKSIGVTWSDHVEASTLRDTLAARGIDDVMLVSDGHAAAALAQAVGRAVGYATTALLFIDRDTATLSVVQTDDGSVVKVLSRSLHSEDAMAVLTEHGRGRRRPGLSAAGHVRRRLRCRRHLGEGTPGTASSACRSVRPTNRKSHWPVVRRWHRPMRRPSRRPPSVWPTPRTPTEPRPVTPMRPLPAPNTQMAPVGGADALVDDYASQTDMEPIAVDEGRKPFLLVGSALTSIFVVGVVALVISLAVSIRPTVDQRPSPGPNAIVPSTVAPPPAPVQEAQQPVAPPPPPAETIKPPVPVAVQEAPPPRQVYVEQAPAPQAPAPAPAAPPPAPEAPPPAPAPVAPAPIPVYPGAGVQPAGVQPVPAAARPLPTPQAVDATVDTAVAAASARAAGSGAAEPQSRAAAPEPAVALARRWLGWLGLRWLGLGRLRMARADSADPVALVARPAAAAAAREAAS